MIALRLGLFALFFLSLPQVFKREFKLPPCYRQIAHNPDWDMPPPQDLLNQPFTYLAHGNQSTVFLSRDGNYVLKLFRYNRTRFPLIHNVKSLFQKKVKNDLFTKAKKTYAAAHIAATEAKEFTQVIYAHLNLSENQLPTIPLRADKTYMLALDRTRFVLQKRADPFKETLLKAKSNPEQMHQLIASWAALILQRASLGIRNSDPNLTPNFGFIGMQAVEIDFGNYRNRPQTVAEIDSYFSRFEHWLEKQMPEYVPYLKNLHIKALISYDPSDEAAKTVH